MNLLLLVYTGPLPFKIPSYIGTPLIVIYLIAVLAAIIFLFIKRR